MVKWQDRKCVSCGWMLKTQSNVVEYQCSKCKRWAVKWEGTLDYEKCPHCGASMQANDRQVTGKLGKEAKDSHAEYWNSIGEWKEGDLTNGNDRKAGGRKRMVK